MRSREEVLERYYELRNKTLRNRKAKLLSKNHPNCLHNVRLPVKGIGKVGLCQNPLLLQERGHPLVCNDDEFSGRCECFECLYTEKLIEQEFNAILSLPSRCGEEFPKLAMLIWFLQDDTVSPKPWNSRLWGHLKRALSELSKVVTFRWLL
jgi:hypothetical protein